MMIPGLTILIFVCAFLIPEIIVLGWRKFLHGEYEAKNGTMNLLYHTFCMFLLMLEFQASFIKIVILWGFVAIAFEGMFALLFVASTGRENEFLLHGSRIYNYFKMFGHPYVIFPLTMSVSFFFYVFQF